MGIEQIVSDIWNKFWVPVIGKLTASLLNALSSSLKLGITFSNTVAGILALLLLIWILFFTGKKK